MTRRIRFALPQNTPSKSRIMAAVADENGNLEMEAIATVADAGEALTLSCMINCVGDIDYVLSTFAEYEQIDDAVVKAIQDAHRDFSPRPPLVSGVPYTMDPPMPPGWHEMPDAKEIDWAKLFRESECHEAEECACGCPGFKEREAKGLTNECRPGGSCQCRKDIDTDDDIIEDCSCTMYDIGPRWAFVLYETLIGAAEGIMEDATNTYMYGTSEVGSGSYAGNAYPKLLGDEDHYFYMKLANTCLALARRLQQGKWPVPETRAEQVMLWWSAGEGIGHHTGGKLGERAVDMSNLEHLPAHDGDLEMEALWLMDVNDEANPKVDYFDFMGDGPVTLDDSFFEELAGAKREHADSLRERETATVIG